MGKLNLWACLTALLIAAGELARFWGSSRLVPLAFDEWLIAAALVWAAWRSRQDGAVWHLPAWGGLCGLALVLLVDTADRQLNGPAKPAGPLYLMALAILLMLGLWALRRALRLVRDRDRR